MLVTFYGLVALTAVTRLFEPSISGRHRALRLWAIRSLGEHWNVRVVDSTRLGVVCSGPYRWIRHPNYVAVFAELTLLPLVGGAFTTVAIGTLLHVIVLQRRIQVEEAMLLGNETYREKMGTKPRFFPARGSHDACGFV